MARKFNPNKIPKKITAFNLDTSILNEFDSYCAKEEKSRSKVANNLIKQFILEKRKRT